MASSTRVFAGIPALNQTLYHRLRFSVGDPVALIEQEGNATLILRDIEMDRARQKARVQQVYCPADFSPSEGLSGDRETATAQALSEYLRQHKISDVETDRSFPMSFVHEVTKAGIELTYNPLLGVNERRAKDEQEIAWLRTAQGTTAKVMTQACQLVANASANADGSLQHEGDPLTSERLQALIDIWLLKRGFSNPGSIVACGPQASDCHHHGSGPLRTEQPIIIDIFPCDKATRYNGDCTRTVVHGTIPDAVTRMHQAVVEAKRAGMRATRIGTTGEAVHRATIEVITQHGFLAERPTGALTSEIPTMTHGTGHGIGLEVHEPPLLDFKGPELVCGDALTIEPGLYSPLIGGVRVEDLVIVTETGCESLNPELPEGLEW